MTQLIDVRAACRRMVLECTHIGFGACEKCITNLLAPLVEALKPFQYMKWEDLKRIQQKYGPVTLVIKTEGHGTEVGHLEINDLLRARAALARIVSPND